MAVLAAKSPAAAGTAPALLWAPDTGRQGTVNVLISNRDSKANTIRLWTSMTNVAGSVKTEELVEADTLLTAAGTTGNAMEKTMLTVGANQALFYAGSSTEISFVVHGYTEAN